MNHTSLDRFALTVRQAWGPLSTEVVRACRRALARLTEADETEGWLASTIGEAPASKELYRDPTLGFVLLAHTETKGLYRQPHDHGTAWVVYGVQSGELEVRTYAKITPEDARPHLVLREETVLRPGMARAYLPGDIHDTRCLSGSALLIRFTERDLRVEDQADRQVTRYVEQGGVWTTAVA
jgi:hypothetical protein